MKTLPRTKVDSIKKAPLSTGICYDSQNSDCQPFWRTVSLDALFQIKLLYLQNDNKARYSEDNKESPTCDAMLSNLHTKYYAILCI